jgi:heterodisulfide reductase subunit A
MSGRKVGVYICHCGGNISDHVDVEKVRRAVEGTEGVSVVRTMLFSCSDASQEEMVADIRDKGLDGLVVASCSPKLHLYTFRGVAQRAGLNPYEYVQVNIREQDSWAHTDDPEAATEKAIGLVRAGIAKAKLTRPLEPTRLETIKKVLVVGAGVAGLRASIALAEIGLHVFLLEREAEAGGWVKRFGRLYPHDRNGKEIVAGLLDKVKARENITLFTQAELVSQSGAVGDFQVKVRAKGEDISLNVGAIIVLTGFEAYEPRPGEYGYGGPGVVTLPEFKELVESAPDGRLEFQGRRVRDIAYIYCVGARQAAGTEGANTGCSRYCCNAALHASLLVSERDPTVHQFHLYRDIRSYGKFETLYEDACRRGSVFVRFAEDEPPRVESLDGDGRWRLTVKDLLTDREELEIAADLVVLVNGMVPRENARLVNILKIPVGKDRFFNEIHPKLRPVETVIDGIFIGGAAQGPKNLSESAASALAAGAKAASLVLKGYVDLEPVIARVDTDRCAWCGKCAPACPYGAIVQARLGDKDVAEVRKALCKGCGACVPVCPEEALDLETYTDAQIKAMIDALLQE